MASVTFTAAAGGDGSTVTDDSNVTTGLANGGHRARFVPALAQIVAVAGRVKDWATLTGVAVYSGLYSAQEWAVGVFTRGAAGGGSAKDWATYLGATVDNAAYSAKEWAVGVFTRGAASGGSAKDWATFTGGTVDNSGYGAKEHAVGTATTTGSAKDWATKLATEVVTGQGFSSKYNANLAAASATSALNAPGTNATSTTSNTVGTGSKTWTIQTGKAFAVGQFMLVARTSAVANYMIGQVTAHDSSTGSITINVTSTGGSGTFTDWTLSLTATSMTTQPFVTVASASTVDLTTAGSENIVISGSTTITAITLNVGQRAFVRFSAALSITSGASLILPLSVSNSMSITTAYNDATAIFIGEDSGVVRCHYFNYGTANGFLSTASASTVDLRPHTPGILEITGTTTITAITLNDGEERRVLFTGILTLTHHATNLKLPGNANITTAAGDTAQFVKSNSVYRCIQYTRAATAP